MSKFDNDAVWQYYVENYFPFMYCLMYMEQVFRSNGLPQDFITEKKREFVKFGKAYFDEKNYIYEEEIVDELVDLDISKEFKAVLIYRYYMYEKNPVVIDFIKEAIKMVQIKDA